MKRSLLIFLLALIGRSSEAQTFGSAFHLYVMENRYNASNVNHIEKNSLYKYYKFMSISYIDPKRENKINEYQIEKGLKKMFPKYSDDGFLCLDWEGELYQILKTGNPNDLQFKKAEKEYIKLVSFVKKVRPKVKVGLYGLPFRVNTASQMKFNADGKFDQILAVCDYISPALYISYPNKQFGQKSNDKFLEMNLKQVLEIGARLHKPVIPYFWYRVHPSNKKFGNQVMDQKEMEQHISFIKNFSMGNSSVAGLIWWEPSDNSNKKISPNQKMSNIRSTSSRQNALDKDIIFYNYTKFLTR